MERVNPQLWYGTRELDHVPHHFTKCPTPVTPDSLLWVCTRLNGRYTISNNTDALSFLLESSKIIYFEDPAEATMYELRWAGGK